jgi:hypothetical protein
MGRRLQLSQLGWLLNGHDASHEALTSHLQVSSCPVSERSWSNDQPMINYSLDRAKTGIGYSLTRKRCRMFASAALSDREKQRGR